MFRTRIDFQDVPQPSILTRVPRDYLQLVFSLPLSLGELSHVQKLLYTWKPTAHVNVNVVVQGNLCEWPTHINITGINQHLLSR